MLETLCLAHHEVFNSVLILSCITFLTDGTVNCIVSLFTGVLVLFSFSVAVKLLLDMGSDINAQIETNRNTALTLACFQVSFTISVSANQEKARAIV